jgi:hypothetical protein
MQMITMKEAQAIEVARQREQQQTPSVAAYEPRSFDEAMRIALVYAQSGLLGKVQSQEAAVMIMAVGAELGIPATTALRGIYIVSGKPVLSSDLIVALCLKRKDLCEYFICTESTDRGATYETKRVGTSAPVRNTFGIDDAKRAKLGLEWDKAGKVMVASDDSNWAKYPRVMLRHRAAAELARMVYPDIVLGLYTESEADELRRESIDVTPQQLVTQPITVQPRPAGMSAAAASKPAPQPERPAPDESLDEAMKRWRGDLFSAESVEDCDKVRFEAKTRLASDSVELAAIARAYFERVKEIKTAATRTPAPQAPLEPEIIDKVKDAFGGDVRIEREPGSDDA